jgi:2-dehydro-3-deoxyphosphooctonate aldolase (KDO 8-P synthase)
MQTVEINGLRIGPGCPHLIIAGPCVIEDAGLILETAAELKRITTELKLSFIFKSSYDKANRSSGNSFRGPGLKEGLAMLAKVKERVGVPIMCSRSRRFYAARQTCSWPPLEPAGS